MTRLVPLLLVIVLGVGFLVASASHGNAGAAPFQLAYVWSPSMPLSEMGIAEARRAAEDLEVELIVVSASELENLPSIESERGSLPSMGAPGAFGTSLVAAGATSHYPSLVVLRGDVVVGSAILGYKRSDAYRALVSERITAAESGGETTPAPLAPLNDPPPSTFSAEGQDMEVVWTHVLSPRPGAFFRHVPGTSFIAYDQRERVYLHDLTSDRAFRGPGWIDFVPSPDGRFFVTPGRNSRGLEFYLASEVLERGRLQGAEDVAPLLTDESMRDQYPSVGILEREPSGRALRYRVLVSWFSGLAFRDYAVDWSEEDPPELVPVSPKLDGCPGLDLSIPILSKDGRELAARDESTGTTKVFRISDDGSCRELLDLGQQTSKAGFSDDGTHVAYSSPDPSSRAGGSTTFVLNRADRSTLRIPYSRSAGLVIPEFVGGDSLLIAVTDGERSNSAEFRLLCCVR